MLQLQIGGIYAINQITVPPVIGHYTHWQLDEACHQRLASPTANKTYVEIFEALFRAMASGNNGQPDRDYRRSYPAIPNSSPLRQKSMGEAQMLLLFYCHPSRFE